MGERLCHAGSRYGSDKLVVLLVDVDYEDVAELADQIEAHVEALQLLTGADRQLYSVKNSGRGGYSIG